MNFSEFNLIKEKLFSTHNQMHFINRSQLNHLKLNDHMILKQLIALLFIFKRESSGCSEENKKKKEIIFLSLRFAKERKSKFVFRM